MNENAIIINHVWRKFPKERKPRTAFQSVRSRIRGDDQNQLVALKDLCLAVKKGGKVGLIGNNGSGKTTLLKIVAGLMRATEGEITINGNMVLLSGLGMGMLDDLSVHDNVYLYGAIYGIRRQEIAETFDEIISWAEIEGFEYAPLKTLSTGMKARLAFSVVRKIKADIFLIDEALSAGDIHFREKTNAFFNHPDNQGRTFFVATHFLPFAENFCAETLWLHHGEAHMYGDSKSVVEEYSKYQGR
jgi:ABC-type polysaccharide/polyol phosphate transport system ATPase subunit